METAAKPEMAIDRGMAGPGLLSYIVTSKFSDYLPLYRLEDIFQRLVATDDTIMPMRSKGKAANARMWVYVGEMPIPTTLLPADAYGG